MKHLPYIWLVIIVCAATACIKRPQINIFGTQPDPNKFECKVNGGEYLPYDGRTYFFAPVNAHVLKLPNAHQLTITATVYIGDNPSRFISLYIPNVTGTGIYEFNVPFQYASYKYNTYYVTGQPSHGNITLTTYDTVAKAIAGTFQFNAINPDNPLDSVKVTGGHFNVTFSTK